MNAPVQRHRRFLLHWIAIGGLLTGITQLSAAENLALKPSEKNLLERVNRYRIAKGLKPVRVEPRLQQTAQRFAEYMAKTDNYGHQADGHRPAARVKLSGYPYILLKENIAYQFNSEGFRGDQLPMRVFESWKTSPVHRQAMTDKDMLDTGIAIVQSERSKKYYAVQLFGRPASARIQFEMDNQTGGDLSYRIGTKRFTLKKGDIANHTRIRQVTVRIETPSRIDFQPVTKSRYTIRLESGKQLKVTRTAITSISSRD